MKIELAVNQTGPKYAKKTSLYFNQNTDRWMQEDIKTFFGAQVIKQHKTYLGHPSLIDRSKTNFFS